MPANTRLLPVREASERIGVSPQTMRNYCKIGKVKALKTPGGHWRIPLHALDTYRPGKERVEEICRRFDHEST